MSPPLISVVLVNWNGRRWLERCLNSLQAQAYQPLEIVVVDNASSDDSISYVRANFPGVKLVLNHENLGFAGGVNSGIAASSGSLILLINNDTWVKPDFVSTLYQELTDIGVDVIAAQEGLFDGSDKPQYSTTIDPLGYPVHVPSGTNFYLSGVCLLFSKQLYEDTGGLDNNFFMYMEEVDWFWRLNLLGKRIAYAGRPRVYHAVSGSTGGQKIRYKVFLWRNQNTPQMLIKNYSAPNLFWVLPAYLLQNLAEIVGFTLALRPKIAYSYLQGWGFNILHLRRTLRGRRQVQAMRRRTDGQIMGRMYKGSGKLRHLNVLLAQRRRRR